ncbi:hypothetical protein BDF21DRAFT_59020 [Thamnidium elegans]|uniref:Uncharacterized protein n=1 Tax=Thamnidium elegans TaxID=101142 RepID=A0A8H7SR33_9FUNG|nr:hypothetical protein INT48_006194 [Thamnidium elegans]KAI8077194.1 hypothetical protein BDF21DRAFT_59020 [Thamnidium elegans]
MVYYLTTNTPATYELQLQQLTKTILETKQQLGIWSDKLLDIRALQMDEAIDMNEETNKTIEMMQDYIIKYQQLLQDMTEKVILVKNSLIHCNTQNYCMNPISF